MRLYIAGPMSGIPEFNFPAFHEAAAELRQMGMEVISPAEVDEATGFNPATDTAESHLVYMKRDLQLVMDADAVALLPGWRGSKGARCEATVAATCGLPLYELRHHPDGGEGRTYLVPVTLPNWMPEIHVPTMDPVEPRTLQAVAAEWEEAITHVNGNERRVTDATTGGEKGTKPEAFSLIPRGALGKVAIVYGVGAEKYARHNWRRGYAWSLSLDALDRHLAAFLDGEDYDPEMTERARDAGWDVQVPHLGAVVFHALALLTFMDEHPELDDRWRPEPDVDEVLAAIRGD
jgi:hypothetical protein